MTPRQAQWLGLFILLHDREDIGRLDKLHHWMVGAFMLLCPEPVAKMITNLLA